MSKVKNMVKIVKSELDKEHQGAVAFEYVIILVIMAVTIFTAWRLMSDAVIDKATDIASLIRNNGRSINGPQSYTP